MVSSIRVTITDFSEEPDLLGQLPLFIKLRERSMPLSSSIFSPNIFKVVATKELS